MSASDVRQVIGVVVCVHVTSLTVNDFFNELIFLALLLDIHSFQTDCVGSETEKNSFGCGWLQYCNNDVCAQVWTIG